MSVNDELPPLPARELYRGIARVKEPEDRLLNGRWWARVRARVGVTADVTDRNGPVLVDLRLKCIR
jgi:hypothetical protein